MRINHIVVGAVVALGGVTLAACGGGYGPSGAARQPAVPVTIAMSTAVKSGYTSLGNVLVSPSGLTMYALTTDTMTNSTCTGACAQVWPPVLVGNGWKAAPGLDRSWQIGLRPPSAV